MSDAKYESIDGALIVGADGATYFIPSKALEAFRVPDEHAGAARDSLSGDVAGFSYSATGGQPFLLGAVGRYGRRPIDVGGTVASPTLISGRVEFRR